MRVLRRALHTTALNGPERSSDDSQHASQYGPVFQVPTGIFSKTIVLCDATAIGTHAFFSSTKNLVRSAYISTHLFNSLEVGRGLTWADGSQHPGHRQALSPMFSDSAVEGYSHVFFDMVDRVQIMWNRALDSRPRGMVIDVQHWCALQDFLDSLGVAGFGHNFDSLSGDYCLVTAAFYALKAPSTNSCADTIFRMAFRFPCLRNVPTARNRLIKDFNAYMRRIANDVLDRNACKGGTDTSVLGLLIKSLAENPTGDFRLSHAEVLAQVCLETSTWLFVELGKNSTIQERLRTELHQAGRQLSYSQLSKLPYLHAVVYEALRLHPPMGDTTRVAAEDDTIPLSSPIATKSGNIVTSINVGKGAVITVPIRHVNTSEAFWGRGADKFDPGRWWQDASNIDFPGSRHLAFGDGPRVCLGKQWVLAQIKVVLSVVISGFEFSFPDGPATVIESTVERIMQPKMSGHGSELLMVVRRL
ncbi:cytochrome P450 [Mycena crocata]|nr:cytochrome P450 [Mycena crocata]